jgi:hypothetical protein
VAVCHGPRDADEEVARAGPSRVVRDPRDVDCWIAPNFDYKISCGRDEIA